MSSVASSSAVPRRYGVFRLAGMLYRTLEDLRTVQQILASVVVVRCEYLHAEEVFAYHAWCAEWAEVPQGHRLPEYEAVFDGSLNTVTWRPVL
jgi:hypothetical protein